MTDHESFLHGIQIASPCHVSWDSMTGDERTRHCHSCQLNVYNIASMSTSEAEQLILKSEGRLCLRMFRRKDGTVITKDCPTGLKAIRYRYYRWVASAAALVSVCALYLIDKQTGALRDAATKVNAKAEAVKETYAPSAMGGGASAPPPEEEKSCSMKVVPVEDAASGALKKFEAVKTGVKHD